jgi:hypothetical protein
MAAKKKGAEWFILGVRRQRGGKKKGITKNPWSRSLFPQK